MKLDKVIRGTKWVRNHDCAKCSCRVEDADLSSVGGGADKHNQMELNTHLTHLANAYLPSLTSHNSPAEEHCPLVC